MASDKKTENSSVEVVLRRFFRETQQSDILTEIKRRRYREKALSRFKRRQNAQVRELRRKEKRGY